MNFRLCPTSPSQVVNILLEYEDPASFFVNDPTADAAVNQAASDISALLSNSMGSLTTDDYK